jgi:hypothetical protein
MDRDVVVEPLQALAAGWFVRCTGTADPPNPEWHCLSVQCASA